MAVYEGSRHALSLVRRVKAADGLTRPTVYADPNRLLDVIDFRLYTTVEGDRIDALAYEFFGTSEFWWEISNANPEILYWDTLPAGITLRIPV